MAVSPKLCPFCLGTHLVVFRYTGTRSYAIQCVDCGAVGPPKKEHEHAIMAWNDRRGQLHLTREV